MPHEDKATSLSQGSTLAQAIAHLRRGLCSDGSDAGSGARIGGSSSDPRGESFQWKALESWASDHGLLLPSSFPGPERMRGMEVDVRFDPADSLWWKYTNPGFAGFTVEWHPGEQPTLMMAAPLQYLERLELTNELFAMGIELRGLWPAPEGGDWRTVTTQPDAVGAAATHEDILHGMEAAGWELLPHADVGRRGALSFRQGSVALWDAHPANIVITNDGTLVPIDVILTRA